MLVRIAPLALVLLIGCGGRAGWCSPTDGSERDAFEARLREAAGVSAVELAETRWARDMDRPSVEMPRLAIDLDGVRRDDARQRLTQFEADPDAFLSSLGPERWGELLPPSQERLVELSEGRLPDDDSGFLIGALLAALTEAAGEPPEQTLLVVDRRVPFQTLARVLYTLGQADRADLAFVVAHRGERSLPARLPVLSVLARRDDSVRLGLTVAQTPQGLVVSGAGGRLDRGCRTTTSSPGTTMDSEDLWALRRCLRRVRNEFPDENEITVTADPDIAFEQVAPVLAAVRADERGPLFDDVMLSAGVR